MRWDPPRAGILDPIVTQPCPKSKRPLSAKGKGKQGDVQVKLAVQTEARKLYLDCPSFDHDNTFGYKKQVQRRTWAEKKIKRLDSRPIDLVSAGGTDDLI
jgi:hypothetical protein